MPNRTELLRVLQVDGDIIALECMGVAYRFDFNLNPHTTAGKTVYEIGRNNVDIPVVVDGDTGHISFLDSDLRLSFINSPFSQLLAAFDFVNAWEIPDDVPDRERARIFREKMLAIDENLFSDPEACWSTMYEEIGYGII